MRYTQIHSYTLFGQYIYIFYYFYLRVFFSRTFSFSIIFFYILYKLDKLYVYVINKTLSAELISYNLTLQNAMKP